MYMNPTVHHRIHNSSPLVPILLQTYYPTSLHPISLMSILIVSTHLRLGLASGLFPSGISTNNMYYTRSFLPHSCYIFRPSHPPLLDYWCWMYGIKSVTSPHVSHTTLCGDWEANWTQFSFNVERKCRMIVSSTPNAFMKQHGPRFTNEGWLGKTALTRSFITCTLHKIILELSSQRGWVE
jgi:hypothetical protein